MENEITNTRAQLEVTIQAQRDPHLRMMRGKALFDAAAADMKFVENPPQGPRSREVLRTAHGRLICRNDGTYTFTMSRIPKDLKFLRPSLVAEVTEAVKGIQDDKGGER